MNFHGMGGQTAFLFAATLTVAMQPGLSAQSAQELLAEAMELHATRLGNVEDVTILQDVMGIAVTTHMVKETVNGEPVLRAVDVGAPGFGGGPMEDVGDLWADPRPLYVGMGDRWSLEDEGSVDGRPTWRLLLTEIDGLDWGPEVDGAGEMRPERIELELDAEELVPRVITMVGEMDRGGNSTPFNLRVELSEYGEVDGYLHPYLTAIETDVGAALSDAEAAEARAALEALQGQLEGMPEGQRAIVEQALAPQIQMLEEMLAGENVRLEVRVRDVRVNEGRPEAN